MGAQLNTVWLVRWGLVAGALGVAGCQALWPRCQSNADCPTGYACRNDGRCIGVEATASSSSSSSGSGSSTSSSSGTTTSSSGGGPFCAANTNVAADRPLPFVVGTEFTAGSCRDGRDVAYYWRAGGLNLRFKTEVRLDVDRFPVDAGRPVQPVFYNLTRGNGPELLGVFAGECRSTSNPSESCIGYINQAMPDLFLEVRPRPLDGGEPYLATGRSTVTINALPCEPAPANTSPDAAIPFGIFGVVEGALCATATTYHWRHDCNQPSCAFSGRFEDDPARVSPFVVEVTQPAGRVNCPVRDGGVFDCEALAFGDGGANLVLVRVDLDAGVAPILSEFVSMRARGIVPPDAGAADGS